MRKDHALITGEKRSIPLKSGESIYTPLGIITIKDVYDFGVGGCLSDVDILINGGEQEFNITCNGFFLLGNYVIKVADLPEPEEETEKNQSENSAEGAQEEKPPIDADMVLFIPNSLRFLHGRLGIPPERNKTPAEKLWQELQTCFLQKKDAQDGDLQDILDDLLDDVEEDGINFDDNFADTQNWTALCESVAIGDWLQGLQRIGRISEDIDQAAAEPASRKRAPIGRRRDKVTAPQQPVPAAA